MLNSVLSPGDFKALNNKVLQNRSHTFRFNSLKHIKTHTVVKALGSNEQDRVAQIGPMSLGRRAYRWPSAAANHIVPFRRPAAAMRSAPFLSIFLPDT